jgi:hypothetical protein
MCVFIYVFIPADLLIIGALNRQSIIITIQIEIKNNEINSLKKILYLFIKPKKYIGIL